MEKLFASMQEVQFSTFSGARSCVSFVPRESEENYLVFSITEGTIGESTPGKAGGRQVVRLYPNMNKVDIMQILVYTLGSYNEFRRPDRDNFVTVNYNNIAQDNQKYFAKSQDNDTTYFNYPFDFDSVTMYFPYAYAMDSSRPSIQSKYESQVIPWTVSLSKYDVNNIQREYQCGIDASNRVDLLRGLVGKCTFEFNFCQWSQDTNDDFDFERQMGDTGTPSTGPQADFSNGIGYYALARARGNHNNVARMISPLLEPGYYCIRFYYYLSGADVHKARLLKRVGGNDDLIVEVEGNQGNLWHAYSQSVQSSDKFEFVVEALMGGSDQGDMAFDDVYILKGKCLF